jgi:hypothetical protein
MSKVFKVFWRFYNVFGRHFNVYYSIEVHSNGYIHGVAPYLKKQCIKYIQISLIVFECISMFFERS